MRIGDVDLDRHVMVVAEVGNNHEGDFTAAQELVGRAAEAGADAVKFQSIVPESLVSAADTERIAQLRRFTLSRDQVEALARQAAEAGVVFFSTPFDLERARFLDSIQPVFKIASGDNNFFQLIDLVASFGKPMIVSTGLADLTLIAQVHDRILGSWAARGIAPGLALLHCVVAYPVPAAEANLGAIATLRAGFPNVVVGYSDHTLGIEAAPYAVAAGARIVEKHFTLDKNRSDFRDHKLSADPEDMRRMVDAIREVSALMGSGEKVPQPCEAPLVTGARRSIAAAVQIPAGTVLADEHLTWLRPGTGLAPGREAELVGGVAARTIAPGELLASGDVTRGG